MKLETTLPGALVAAFCLSPVHFGLPSERDTVRVSVTTAGVEASFRSNFPVISGDGSVVAFESSADDLVPGDTNFAKDIFVHDLNAGTTTRVSLSSTGAQGNHHSTNPSISANGRLVLFTSKASNLVAGDTNNLLDVFLHDRDTGVTTRVSEDPLGVQANGVSDQGDIAPDGSMVSFYSAATNLVGSDTNGTPDIFVRDLTTNATTLASVSTAGVQSDNSSFEPALSADGQTVTFYSLATNLVTGDTNGKPDVFVHELVSGQTTRVSVSSSGAQGNSYSQAPKISAGGRYVAFESRADTLVPNDLNFADDVFVHDRVTAATSIVSVASSGIYGNGASRAASISADGQRVSFQSSSNNLVAADLNGSMDAFVHDTLTQATRRVSLDSTGLEGNNNSIDAVISADGRYVAFQSDADNLVSGDTNAYADIFLNDSLGTATIASRNAGPNVMSYTASAPVLGSVWTASVDLTTTGHSIAQVVATVAPANVTFKGGQVLLIGGAQLLRLPPRVGPVAVWMVTVPNDSSLAGLTASTQAVHFGGVKPFALSNAQDVCFGY